MVMVFSEEKERRLPGRQLMALEGEEGYVCKASLDRKKINYRPYFGV